MLGTSHSTQIKWKDETEHNLESLRLSWIIIKSHEKITCKLNFKLNTILPITHLQVKIKHPTLDPMHITHLKKALPSSDLRCGSPNSSPSSGNLQ